MSVTEEQPPILSQASPEDMFIRFDWPRILDRQLVEKSQQDHIVRYESDDTDVIFRNVNAVRQWRRERFDHSNPMVVWLGTATSELAGIAWIENVNRDNG